MLSCVCVDVQAGTGTYSHHMVLRIIMLSYRIHQFCSSSSQHPLNCVDYPITKTYCACLTAYKNHGSPYFMHFIASVATYIYNTKKHLVSTKYDKSEANNRFKIID